MTGKDGRDSCLEQGVRLACAVGASRRRTGKHRRREAGADAIIGRCCRPKRASISQVRCKGRIVYGRGRAVPPVNQLVKFCVKETHNGERTPERWVGDEAVEAVTTRLLSYPFTTTRRIPPCSWKLTKYCSGIEDALRTLVATTCLLGTRHVSVRSHSSSM